MSLSITYDECEFKGVSFHCKNSTSYPTSSYFLDSSGLVATSGIILGSQSYKFSQTGHVSSGNVSSIKSLLNLSTSQTKAAKDAFFGSLENIILENHSLSQLIRLPTSVSREGSEKLTLREAAFVIEEPIPLDLSLIEPPEIV